MAEWVYKASRKMASFGETRYLANTEGFLCKAAFEAKGTSADYVTDVHAGDIIHFFYVDTNTTHTIGSFKVLPAASGEGRFSGQVAGTELTEVVDPALLKRLVDYGYKGDPVTGKMTGWLLEKQKDATTPSYSKTMFPGMSVLRPCP